LSPTDPDVSDLGRAVQDVTERVGVLVREEIELAKAEMTEKVSRLIKGAVVGIVAGVFAVFGLVYLLHAGAWGIWEATAWGDSPWSGYLIVAVLLFLLGAIAGFVAMRLVKRGSPPKPELALEEAQLIRATLKEPHPPEARPLPETAQAAAAARRAER
jgi:uncharacterized membrane protein YqjE